MAAQLFVNFLSTFAFGQAVQIRAADDFQPRPLQQTVEPERVGFEARAGLPSPSRIVQRMGARPQRRTRHRPRPQLGGYFFGHVGSAHGKAQAHPGQPEKLAERAQHDQACMAGMRGDGNFWRHIGEGLVHHQCSAPVQQFLGERQQPFDRLEASGGIVGMHQYAERRGPCSLGADRGDVHHMVSSRRPRGRMFAIGRPHHGDVAGRK